MNNNEEDYIDDAFDDDAYEQDQQEDKKKHVANVVGNAHIQNDLVDKEVEQVVMKSASTKEKKPKAGGYALPGDSAEDDEGDVDMDDEDQDEDDEEVQEDHGEDEEDIDQQIVNITSKNQRAQPQPQMTDEEMAQKQQNDAILVINNQQNADRPQTKQVKQRQAATAQGQRPQYFNQEAQLPQGVSYGAEAYSQFQQPEAEYMQDQQ